MKQRRVKRKSSLSRQLLIHAAIPIMIGMVLITMLILHLMTENITGFLEKEVRNEAILVGERLDGHFEKYMQLVAQGKYNYDLQKYLKEVKSSENALENPHYEPVQKVLDSLLETKENSLHGTLWIADVDANIVLEDSRSGAFLTSENDWNFVERPWANEAFFSYDVFFSEPYCSKTGGKMVVSIICPVRDWDTRQLLGVLGIDIEISSLKEIIEIENTDIYSRIILLDSKGMVLSCSDDSRILKSYKELEELRIIEQIWERAGKEPYQYTCEEHKMLGSVVKTENPQWTIISEVSMEAIDNSIYRLITPMLLVYMVGTFLGVIYQMVIIKKHLLHPLREVEAAAERISQGTLDFELELESAREIQRIAHALNVDVKEAFQELREKERHITEGMEYARLLQKRIAYVASEREKFCSDFHYVLRSTEIVGGDFLWGTAVEDGMLIALGDCTGHGVSGALLSVMTVSVLRGIIEKGGIRQLDEILWRLDQSLSESLNGERRTGGFEIPAGVDIGLIKLYTAGGFSFVGTQNCLYIEKNDVVEVIKGEKLKIGEGKVTGPKNFTIHTFEQTEGMSCYLATDGLFDQPGGDRRLPFGYNRFKRIVIKYKENSMKEIIAAIVEEFDYYRGKEEQRDDVTIFGFRM